MKTITIGLLWSQIFYEETLYEYKKDSAILDGGFCYDSEYPETEWEQTGVFEDYHGLNVVPTWGHKLFLKMQKLASYFM